MWPRVHAQKNPDKVCYRMARGGETVSYGQLDKRATRTARSLAAPGSMSSRYWRSLLRTTRYASVVARPSADRWAGP